MCTFVRFILELSVHHMFAYKPFGSIVSKKIRQRLTLATAPAKRLGLCCSQKTESAKLNRVLP